MSCLTATKLNLTQALRIQANQYRSADNRRDYQKEEIDDTIFRLQARKDATRIQTNIRQQITAILKDVRTTDELPPSPADEGLNDFDFEVPSEYWVLSNGFSTVAIPPQILPF